MRWTIGRRRDQPADTVVDPRRSWADRLGAVGQTLDDNGITIRDVSISITGDETWLCGWAWFAGRLRSGWSVTALRVDGPRLIPAAPGAAPFDRVVGDRTRSPWAPRLRAVGLLLDRSAQPLLDPWLLEVGDGFVVTVLTTIDGARGSRVPLSREFAPADLDAALGTERAGRQGVPTA